MEPFDIAPLNAIRIAQGFLTIPEVIDLAQGGNVIYDPFSVLISRRCKIGINNTIFPCVSLISSEQGELQIGDNNTFHTNTLLSAETGMISIGANNQFGEGGFTAKANREGATIRMGDFGRYLGGACVFGQCDLGSGSQILGPITVDSCFLEAGGSYLDHNPDMRAGLLKGAGIARNLVVPVGQVIAGNGMFRADDMQPQSFFHPKS